MKITSIKPAVKTKGRYNVFVDGKYSFSLIESQVLEEKLHTGAEIDDSRLGELKKKSDFGKKYARVLELIMRRPRSQKEIRDYARRKGWDDDEGESVIQKLTAKNYLNDNKFAEFWLRARNNSKPSSRLKLVAELRQKGVSHDIIENVFIGDEVPSDSDTLRRIIEKKRHKYNEQSKLIAYLARQGFRYDDIKDELG